jgi:hypothetical protein
MVSWEVGRSGKRQPAIPKSQYNMSNLLLDESACVDPTGAFKIFLQEFPLSCRNNRWEGGVKMNRLENFKKYHIEKLKNKLNDIYTVDPPEGYSIGQTDKKIHLLDELDFLTKVEEIYSVIESTDNPNGETYNNYRDYLEKTREAIQIIKTNIKEIESKYEDEIKNINILLESFEKHLDNKQ